MGREIAADARRVRIEAGGPLLVEGPVEIALEDGTVARSERFMVAVCTCRRSRSYPWCDTSHRARRQPTAKAEPNNRDEQRHEEPHALIDKTSTLDRNSP
ncbi:CDGSH iron-sulfur domain-containing protein [Streptomyces sp. NPDC095817]|uniref:CDGSH iron-sulfur domain-containing protein n=1 Tax=Streptomyces sp. NPDC095817 TaxID=3155082 RepID=UPI0033242DA0